MNRTWIAGMLVAAACGGRSTDVGPSGGSSASAAGASAAQQPSGGDTGADLDGSTGAPSAASFDAANVVSADASSTVTLGGVTVASDGQETGALTGIQWSSAASGSTGTVTRNPTSLCISGTIAPVTCTADTAVTADACSYSTDYGVLLGFNTTNPQGPWGSAAPSMLAVEYSGTPGVYDLFAHVSGDPGTQWYGLPNYTSGQFVPPGSLTLEYWNVPPSTALASFQSVDQLALYLEAEPTVVMYDFCVTAISVQ